MSSVLLRDSSNGVCLTTALERINSVGMAVQILDSISNKSGDLKNETKSEIVKALLKADLVSERGQSPIRKSVAGRLKGPAKN
jgi:hypothetical protein